MRRAGRRKPGGSTVLRLIAAITEAAGASTRVAVCGELAADSDAAAVLIGLGVDELSMASPMNPAVKRTIRPLSHTEANTSASGRGQTAVIGGSP